MKAAKKRARPNRLSARQPVARKLRAAKPPFADLREFYGILTEQEADQMIRDIDEAFEHVDAA